MKIAKRLLLLIVASVGFSAYGGNYPDSPDVKILLGAQVAPLALSVVKSVPGASNAYTVLAGVVGDKDVDAIAAVGLASALEFVHRNNLDKGCPASEGVIAGLVAAAATENRLYAWVCNNVPGAKALESREAKALVRSLAAFVIAGRLADARK